MNKIVLFRTMLFLFIGFYTNAQTLVWTGATNSDFFDEGNWKNSATNLVPSSGTINPNQSINLPLQINNGTADITASGIIDLGTGSLAIGLAKLSAQSISKGNLTVNEGGYLDLSSTTPLLSNIQINFTSGIGWVRTTNYKASAVSLNNLGQIKVNNNTSIYQTNLRLDNYYL